MLVEVLVVGGWRWLYLGGCSSRCWCGSDGSWLRSKSRSRRWRWSECDCEFVFAKVEFFVVVEWHPPCPCVHAHVVTRRESERERERERRRESWLRPPDSAQLVRHETYTSYSRLPSCDYCSPPLCVVCTPRLAQLAPRFDLPHLSTTTTSDGTVQYSTASPDQRSMLPTSTSRNGSVGAALVRSFLLHIHHHPALP